jgi:glycosyltransferase involved in cell wall biosynthesis
MRILIHDYAGHAFPVSLSRALARRGHTVAHVFASQLQTPRGDLRGREGDSDRLSFIAAPMDPDYPRYKYSFLRRRRMERNYGLSLASLIAEERPDVVLSGQTPSDAQHSIVKQCRALGIPFCYWVQDFYGVAIKALLRKKLWWAGHLVGSWYERMDRGHLRSSAAVVSITEDFLPLLQREGVASERCHVIPNWADLEALPVMPKVNPWSERNGLADKFVFLYSGTLGMKHNPALLRDLTLHLRNRPDVCVVVNSEGKGANWLLEEKRRRGSELDGLIINGYQPFSEMPQVLGAADVFIAVLEPEAGVFSVPSKILAYHCAGRPILTAMPRENLAARTIEKEGTGMVVTPDNTPAFLAAADFLLDDVAQREAMGTKARRYAEQTFDLEVITDRFEGIFERAKGERREVLGA